MTLTLPCRLILEAKRTKRLPKRPREGPADGTKAKAALASQLVLVRELQVGVMLLLSLPVPVIRRSRQAVGVMPLRMPTTPLTEAKWKSWNGSAQTPTEERT